MSNVAYFGVWLLLVLDFIVDSKLGELIRGSHKD